jgi:hypothetical protein
LQADIDHVAAEGSVVVSFFEIEARGGEEQQVAVEGIVANLISDGKIERSVAGYEIVPLLSGRWRWPFRR